MDRKQPMNKETLIIKIPKGIKDKIYKKIKDRRGMNKYINNLIMMDLMNTYPSFNDLKK